MEKLLSTEEIAEGLGVQVDTVQRWLSSGKLKGTKIGRLWRVREEDLDKFIKGCGSSGKEA